jgi:microcystin-dependent protein
MSYTPTFLYNNHSVTPPPGSVISYIGTIDPDGWVICDGVNRTVSDGRFIYLAPLLNTALGVLTNTSNSITPPNLKSKFIYGGSNILSNGGSSSVTLSETNLPPHNHNVTDSGHSHTINGADNAFITANGTSYSVPPDSNAGLNSSLSVSTNTGKANLSCSNTGGGQSFSILPPYSTMNFIIKY